MADSDSAPWCDTGCAIDHEHRFREITGTGAIALPALGGGNE